MVLSRLWWILTRSKKEEGNMDTGADRSVDEEASEDDLGNTPAKTSANAIKKQKKDRNLLETTKVKIKEEPRSGAASSKSKQ